MPDTDIEHTICVGDGSSPQDDTPKKVAWFHLHRRLYNWTLSWANHPSSAVALFILSFAESSFFPIPPDTLLAPLVLGNRNKWIRFATLCTVASVAGGIAGYCIGMWAWEAGVEDFMYKWFAWAGFTQETYTDVHAKFKEWNFWVVFTAGFTPIPFKLITITSGVFKINFATFVIAATISRAARFFLVAGLMRKFGPSIQPFMDKYLGLISLLLMAGLIGGFIALKYI